MCIIIIISIIHYYVVNDDVDDDCDDLISFFWCIIILEWIMRHFISKILNVVKRNILEHNCSLLPDDAIIPIYWFYWLILLIWF